MNDIYIGTSGYSYAYWKNRFYPKGITAATYLSYYATHFRTVELNYTFYRFPQVATLLKAAASVPDDFRFSIKANKVITHTLRMKSVQEKISEFTAIVTQGLGEHLGCILYQLPPSYSYSAEALQQILEQLGGDSRNVVEFRNSSWWQDEVYAAFRNCGLTFCNVSYPDLPESLIRTSDLFYLRLHGVPELFKTAYSDDYLAQLATQLPVEGKGFVYFNNTMYEAGYRNAAQLQELLSHGIVL